MSRQLAGERALITGGASGLGLGMGLEFLRRGAQLVVVDRAEGLPPELAENPSVQFIHGDVTDPRSLGAAFEAAEAAGPLTIAVANAGVSQSDSSVDLPIETWRRVMAINLDGAFLTAQEAARRMIARGRGSILFMASIYGVVAAPNRLAYVVSKSGVSAMTKSLAIEWAPHGLRVNALAPGYVRTPLLDDLIARKRVDPDKLLGHTPMGRFIEIDEVAKMAAFIVSNEASATTGLIASADGGWTVNGYL